MLHVALLELPACCAKQVLAEEIGRGVHERHRILQLVAEAIGPRRLIE